MKQSQVLFELQEEILEAFLPLGSAAKGTNYVMNAAFKTGTVKKFSSQALKEKFFAVKSTSS
jgi:hypothetical protein